MSNIYAEEWEVENSGNNYPFTSSSELTFISTKGTIRFPKDFILDARLTVSGSVVGVSLDSIKIDGAGIYLYIRVQGSKLECFVTKEGAAKVTTLDGVAVGCILIGPGVYMILNSTPGSYVSSSLNQFLPRAVSSLNQNRVEVINVAGVEYSGDVPLILSPGITCSILSSELNLSITGDPYKERDALYKSLPITDYIGVAARSVNGVVSSDTRYNTYNIVFSADYTYTRLLVLPIDNKTLKIVDIKAPT